MPTIDHFEVAVPTRSPTGSTTAYRIRDQETVLVDPARPSGTLNDAAADGIDHIAVTHSHPDHVGGVAEIRERTGATVWCRRGYESRFEREAGVAPDQAFIEGTTVGPLTTVDTPGHSPDHVSFRLQTEDGPVLVCGDLAVETGSVVVGAPDGDLRSYLTSLRRLRAGPWHRWYPAHGPIIENPGATAERLITHRLDREQRILAAVETGAQSVDAVLDAAYDKDLQGVEDLARATVRTHLEKLAIEGKVRYGGGDSVAPSRS